MAAVLAAAAAEEAELNSEMEELAEVLGLSEALDRDSDSSVAAHELAGPADDDSGDDSDEHDGYGGTAGASDDDDAGDGQDDDDDDGFDGVDKENVNPVDGLPATRRSGWWLAVARPKKTAKRNAKPTKATEPAPAAAAAAYSKADAVTSAHRDALQTREQV